jgi:outer membrane protein assembly factor BamB
MLPSGPWVVGRGSWIVDRESWMVSRAIVLMFVVLGWGAAHASDWPEFRGPTGQGISTEHGLPLEWSESRNVVWKTDLPGLGWSSPVVADGRVWLTVAVTGPSATSLRVMAFDVATGRAIVDKEAFNIRKSRLLNAKNSFASPTPIVEGNRVYVHFGNEGTAALTTAGDVVWTSNKHRVETQHGDGGSPVLYRDLLIFNCDGYDEAYVVALDKHTGKQVWQTFRRAPWSQAYSTPLVVRVADRDQLISVGAFRATAYDPLSGKEIWRVGYEDGFSNVPRPVFGHGLVYIATGFQEPSMIAVRADGAGDITRTHIAWSTNRGAPHTPSPILVGAELYFVSDAGIASCVDARTGALRWQQRLGGNYSASPVSAEGRIYFQSEEGVTTVIAAAPVFKKLAANALDGLMLASLAVADKSIFIRTDSALYRIGIEGLRN